MFIADSALALGHSFLSSVECHSSSTQVGHMYSPYRKGEGENKGPKRK